MSKYLLTKPIFIYLFIYFVVVGKRKCLPATINLRKPPQNPTLPSVLTLLSFQFPSLHSFPPSLPPISICIILRLFIGKAGNEGERGLQFHSGMSWEDEIVMRDVTNAGLVISDRIGREVSSQLDLEEALEASRYASHPYSTHPREVSPQNLRVSICYCSCCVQLSTLHNCSFRARLITLFTNSS